MFVLLQAVEFPVSCCKLHVKVLNEAADSHTSGTIVISGIYAVACTLNAPGWRHVHAAAPD